MWSNRFYWKKVYLFHLLQHIFDFLITSKGLPSTLTYFKFKFLKRDIISKFCYLSLPLELSSNKNLDLKFKLE